MEFEIVFSAYTFDLEQRLSTLAGYGFSPDEIATLAGELRQLTNRIVNRQTGLWQSDAQKLTILEKRRDTILASELAPAEKLYWLLEDCKRDGTLPFAGLARAGFIAIQMLRSLVAVGVLSGDEMAGPGNLPWRPTSGPSYGRGRGATDWTLRHPPCPCSRRSDGGQLSWLRHGRGSARRSGHFSGRGRKRGSLHR